MSDGQSLGGASGSNAGAGGVPGASGSGGQAPNGGTAGGVPSGSQPGGDSGATSWTTGFTPELQAYVQQKGFKDPAAVVDSYRNFEKLRGAPIERILTLPEKLDDATAMNPIYDKLGRPEKPEGYNLPMPKEGANEPFAKFARDTFHKLGLSKGQGEKLVGDWNSYVAAQNQEHMTKHNAKVQADDAALKTEWGQAYDQNVQVAKLAAEKLGFNTATLDILERAMGFGNLMKFVHNLGGKMGEGKFVAGDSQNVNFNGILTPAQARGRIESLKGDHEFRTKYIAGGSTERSEMERLHKMAYPEG